MTGSDLRRLRYGLCMDSAPRLARRLGCHETTIRRNEKRPHVTNYVDLLVETHDIARAFLSGLNFGD